MDETPKKVPNPYGRKGCKEHQDMILLEAKRLQLQGLDADMEHELEFPDGSKRYVDVAGIDQDFNVKELVQVGVQTKGGLPVARERRVIDKIKSFFGIPVTFVPYKTL